MLNRMTGTSLESLRIEDEKRERLKLEREEKQRIAELENLSAQEKELFKKGCAATSEAEAKTLRGPLRQLEKEIRAVQLELKRITDEIRILNDLILIIENRSMLENAALWSKVIELPESKLRRLAVELRKGHLPIDTRSIDYEDDEEVEVDDEEAEKLTKEILHIWSMDLCENSSEPSVKTMSKQNIERGKPVGRISHYFKHIEIAVIELSGVLRVGDVIRIVGGEDTDFTQTIKAMEVEHKKVEEAQKGESVGLKLKGKVREGYLVYRIASYAD